MIARLWHGAVPLEKSTEYLHKMRTIAIPDYKRTPGNRGAYCLRRIEGNVAHFEMLTFWDDVEAIKRFAGEDCELARHYDFDADFLLEKDSGTILVKRKELRASSRKGSSQVSARTHDSTPVRLANLRSEIETMQAGIATSAKACVLL